MKRNTMLRFYILLFLEVMAANMVHPVTPSFLMELEMPSFMFGAAFAAMSLANFLFCPLWGSMGDNRSRVKTMGITVFLYALGQVFFLKSRSIWQIILARLFAGAFSGGATVCFMAYVADCAEGERCGNGMAICAALTSAATSIGYLVGGMLGDISVETAFYGQILLLFLSAAGMLLTLKEGPYFTRGSGNVWKALNPFSTFANNRAMFTRPTVFFLAAVFLACFASTAYDNAFNYFLKDQFHFPPSYNGYIYAAIGIISVMVNMTLGLWLQQRTNCHTPLVIIFCVACASLLVSLTTKHTLSYISVNMVFYLCNSMYLPLQQALAIRQCQADHGTVSGVFSSVRAVGMVAGSLSAGFLYELAPLLPMGVCGGVFLAAAGITYINLRQQKGAHV